MKVILLKDVPKVGKKYEVKNVSQGYATNFLLPRKLAKTATEKEIQTLNLQLKREQENAQVQSGLLEEAFQSIKGQKILISKKTNEKGHLFSAIHKDEIKKAITEQLRVDIEEKWICLEDPVKEIGEREIIIDSGSIKTNIKLFVDTEK